MSEQQAAPSGVAIENAPAELHVEGAAAPADGAAAGEQQQPSTEDPNAPAPEGQAPKPVPEDRTARYRFSEISRQKREAEIAAAEARAEARTLREILANGGRAPSVPGQTQQPAQSGPPNPADYGGEYSDEYRDAMIDWRVEQKLKAKDDERAESERVAADRATFESGKARFVEVLEEARTISDENEGLTEGAVNLLRHLAQDARNTPLIDQINATDNAVWVAEQLARNPELRAKVFAMPPIQRGIALGRMDGDITRDLESQRAQPQRQVAPSTPSPQPVQQANGRGAGPAFNPEKATADDYIAARQSGRYV